MKKTIIFLCFLLTLGLFSFKSIAGPILTFRLEFGKNSCGCCGFGFCHLDIGFDFNNDKIPLAGDGAVLGTLSFDKGKAVFVFYKKSMSLETINKYFGSGYFIIEEKSILPEEVSRLLKVDNYEIPVGKYKIIDQAETFIVKI